MPCCPISPSSSFSGIGDSVLEPPHACSINKPPPKKNGVLLARSRDRRCDTTLGRSLPKGPVLMLIIMASSCAALRCNTGESYYLPLAADFRLPRRLTLTLSIPSRRWWAHRRALPSACFQPKLGWRSQPSCAAGCLHARILGRYAMMRAVHVNVMALW